MVDNRRVKGRRLAVASAVVMAMVASCNTPALDDKSGYWCIGHMGELRIVAEEMGTYDAISRLLVDAASPDQAEVTQRLFSDPDFASTCREARSRFDRAGSPP